MGIKHLWPILTPFGERKPLYELQGKTVAIDLSCWICEAQNITEYYVQPKMYLRNLYFRTCYLLLMDVNPVFVLEGKAPELKYDTIAARNEIQFKGAKPRAEGAPAKVGKDRSRFNFVLKCCEEMLGCMGLACLKGKGEAEALCAYLNEDKLVDGCISQDSDCFAYGARIVYRNFSISQQGVHAASGGAVDVYDLQKAIDGLSFGRNKIIAMALLCGSDYSDGVFGVGKEAALKLFEHVADYEILERLRSWKTNPKLYDDFCRKLNDKNVCSSCGHGGKVQGHARAGCKDCGTTAGCDFSKFRDERLKIKNEVAMRGKALVNPDFPDEDLIKEFLVRKDSVSKLDLQWKRPDMNAFVKFTAKHLQWDPIYAWEKFLPILTRWQLLNFKPLQSPPQKPPATLIPARIKKIRNPKGVPSYEIIWTDPDGHYANITSPEQQPADEKLYSTIEPQQLVREAHPYLVQAFEQSKLKPKKAPKRRKIKDPVDDIDGLLANTSISEPKPKKKTTRVGGVRKPVVVKCHKIDSYFKQAVLNNLDGVGTTEGDTAEVDDLDASNFGDESVDFDVSGIVQEIVQRAPPAYIRENLDRLGLGGDEESGGMDQSSFFMTGCVDGDDLFEKSMRFEALSDSEADEDDLPDNNETFSEEYVPLITRLQLKT